MTNIRCVVSSLRRQAEQQLAVDIEAIEQRCYELAGKLPLDTRRQFASWAHQAFADPDHQPTFEQAAALVECWQGGLWKPSTARYNLLSCE